MSRTAPEFDDGAPALSDSSIAFGYHDSGDNPSALDLSRTPPFAGSQTRRLWSQGDDVSKLSSTCEDTGLQPGTTYYYTLTNTYGDGAKNSSDTRAFTTTGQTPADRASSSSLPVPSISVRGKYGKTLTADNRIDFEFGSPGGYNKYLARWFPLSAPDDATQVDVNGGTLGLWTAGPLQPKAEYTIAAKGGNSSGFLNVSYDYSEWASMVVQASDNHHSLRTFLSQSGVDGTSGVRRFIGSSASLRAVMGVVV